MLKADTYEYKACQNNGWDVAVPQSGNMQLTIAEDGAYKVTFTLTNANNLEEASLMAEAVKTGEYEGSDEVVWIVAGSEELMGVFWKGTIDEGGVNKMTTTDNKIYTLTKKLLISTSS